MKNKDILLINPPIYDFAAFDLWLKPLGLLYVASFLEKFGYSVSLIDCLNRHHPSLKTNAAGAGNTTCAAGATSAAGAGNAAGTINATATGKKDSFDTGHFPYEITEKPDCYKTIPRRYKRYGIGKDAILSHMRSLPSPALAGITCTMAYWYKGAFETIKDLRSIHPHTPIALGGIYASLFPEHAKKYSGADFVIEKDGRLQMLKLADSICGISRNYNSIDLSIDNNPYPAYHLIENLQSVSMITSLGCPFRCTYCASGFLHPQYCKRNWKKVYEEILYYKERFNIKDIAFYDDALLHNSNALIKPLLRALTEKNTDIRFHLPNGIHTRLVDEEIARLFFSTGFKTVRLSFESSDKDEQKERSDSKTENAHLEKAIKFLVQAGYKNGDIEVYILLGLPGQKASAVTASANFVHNAGAIVKTAQYSPIPHTKDFEKALCENGIIKEDPLYTNNTIFPAMIKGISFEEYQQIKDTARALNEKLRRYSLQYQ